MDLRRALAALGLQLNFTRDDVNKAYKSTILKAHPDKNKGSDNATEEAQLLNEARDYLLNFSNGHVIERERMEAQRRMEEEEANIKRVEEWIKEVDIATEEAKEHFRIWMNKTNDLYMPVPPSRWVTVREAYYKRMKSLSRCERYNESLKKKRKDGTRAHRKTLDYKDGKLAIKAIEIFIKEHIKSSTGDRLAVSAIYKRFAESKDDVSELEVSLFRRHYKKMLLQQYPTAYYCRNKLQRSFAHVALK